MEISKKDLLKETGISYGQLYRWKREGLIPEEWFVKRSAYTGQETFFPRDKILPRIKAILELKEQYSLEEMARMFTESAPITPSPAPSDEIKNPPVTERIPLTDLPPKMQMIVGELYPNGINPTQNILLCALAKLTEPLTLTLSETKSLIQSALSIQAEAVDEFTLTLWCGDRPHYFLTLHKDGGIVMDCRFAKSGEINLNAFTIKP